MINSNEDDDYNNCWGQTTELRYNIRNRNANDAIVFKVPFINQCISSPPKLLKTLVSSYKIDRVTIKRIEIVYIISKKTERKIEKK